MDPNAATLRSSSQARGAGSPTHEGARQYSFIDEKTWQQLQCESHPQPEPKPHPEPEHAQPTIPTDIPRHETHPVDDKTELASHSLASEVVQHPEIYAKSALSDSESGSGSTVHPRSQTGSKTEEEHLLTTRFKHVVTDSGHAIITGREGEQLQYCEDEPIRIVSFTPGYPYFRIPKLD